MKTVMTRRETSISGSHETEISDSPPRKTTVLILSKSLRGEGGVVNFVSMMLPNLSGETEFGHLEIGRESSSRNHLMKLWILLQDSRRFLRKLSAQEFEVFQLNTSLNRKALIRDGCLLALAHLFGFRKSIVFIHGWDADFAASLEKSSMKMGIFSGFFTRAARLIVLSSSFKETLVRLGFDPHRILVLSTMFDGEMFREIGAGDQTGAPTILFLSRLVPEKGIYELLEAVERLSARFNDLKIEIVGDGPERQAIEDWVRSRKLDGRVRMRGYLRGQEKAKAFAGAGIFVLPTRHGEGCPVTLLEAMAAGLPVITTPVGGIPDVFRDGVNGFLLRDRHPDTIAESIDELLRNPALRQRIGEQNREEAWRRFEARLVTGRLERLFHEVAAE